MGEAIYLKLAYLGRERKSRLNPASRVSRLLAGGQVAWGFGEKYFNILRFAVDGGFMGAG